MASRVGRGADAPASGAEFLRRVGGLRVWKGAGTRAPHKPLLLLLALGRLVREAPRLGSYGREIEPPLRGLLERFGPPRKAHHPEHPFHRLLTDGLWEIPGFEDLPTTSWGDLRPKYLREHGIRGGFPEPVQRLLLGDRELVEQAATRLLADHFPESLHQAIRDEVGLHDSVVQEDAAFDSATRRRRDPGFRDAVLTAYERCCAVCDYDIRLSDDLFGLEAAHIRWHSHGGPDTIPNGLALCTFHHRAFDRGAIGLEPIPGDGFALLVSRRLSGRSEALRQLVDARGRPLRPPQEQEFVPNLDFVAWHRKQVFQGEPRGAW